ncbi:MAG: metal-dependent hydrolase [Nanoarchaeota archaeon]|nr:metal-dependent hydrolase [Nanoarchaeota archaeon]
MLEFSHIVIALAIAKFLGFSMNYLNIFILALFAVLPDIDIPSSVIGRILFPISRYFYQRFGHRSLTHSLIFMLFLCNLTFFWRSVWYLSLIAYSSHLFADMLTYNGVMLLYPYKRFYVIFNGRLKTGGVAEIFIFSVLFIYCFSQFIM